MNSVHNERSAVSAGQRKAPLSRAKGWKITVSKGGPVTMVNDHLTPCFPVFFTAKTPCACTSEHKNTHTHNTATY